MNVNGRMNLLFVKRVILGSANLVGDVGSKLPQTVEIHLSKENRWVKNFQVVIFLAYKDTEFVITIDCAHEARIQYGAGL
jgi:hypothetical protein